MNTVNDRPFELWGSDTKKLFFYEGPLDTYFRITALFLFHTYMTPNSFTYYTENHHTTLTSKIFLHTQIKHLHTNSRKNVKSHNAVIMGFQVNYYFISR